MFTLFLHALVSITMEKLAGKENTEGEELQQARLCGFQGEQEGKVAAYQISPKTFIKDNSIHNHT